VARAQAAISHQGKRTNQGNQKKKFHWDNLVEG
jgi:hypothetical protein